MEQLYKNQSFIRKLAEFSVYLTIKMVSVEKYPCFFNAGLKRFKSKDGRHFLKCKNESCTLFVPEEKYTELMEAYEVRVDQMFKPYNFPHCFCEDASSLWVSHSSNNPDRPYFRCQDTALDEKCDFFQWADLKLKKKKQRTARTKKEKCMCEKGVSDMRKLKKLKPLESSDGEN